ncbi:uncharacterized protein LOC108601771 isoform X2 [Drosophila busckii]|uniref:uncharacterized protein LOC108601771 isoform X2 n=1 Tax=Drosophila busckii TaxID=30019 RepID=UPI00083E9E99|nr:uncharacterized protein LOC108601771 isoform X2 [Drosophila busckii]
MKSDEIIEKIRNRLKDADPDKRTVMSTFQFNFTDADGKLIKSMALDIYEGQTANADGRITIADEDFYLIGTKQTSFDQVVAEQKAQIDGDSDAINSMMAKFRLNSPN